MRQLRIRKAINYNEDMSIMDNKNAEPLSHTFKMIDDRGGDKNKNSQEYCRREDHQEDWGGDYPHVGCAGDKHK